MILMTFSFFTTLFGQSYVWESKSPQGPIYGLSFDSNNFLYAGIHNFGMYYSKDGGQTWSGMNDTLIDTRINAFAISGSSIYAATENGLFKTTNNGISWNLISTSFSGQSIKSIIIVPKSNTILAGTYQNYIYRSTNNGSSWSKITDGFDRSTIASFGADSSGIIFAGTDNNIYRSTSDGTSWAKVANNITPNYVLSFAVSKGDSVFVGTSDRGILRSGDKGISWKKVNAGLDTTDEIRSINATLLDGQIFAASKKSGIYHSTNYGNSWNKIDSGLTDMQTTILALSSNRYLYAGGSGFNIFRTTLQVPILSSIIQEKPGAPFSFEVKQNFPNPFNPVTKINYEIKEQNHVILNIYDIAGRWIKNLHTGIQSAGFFSVTWDGRNENGELVGTGAYFYQLKVGDYYETKKMILLK